MKKYFILGLEASNGYQRDGIDGLSGAFTLAAFEQKEDPALVLELLDGYNGYLEIDEGDFYKGASKIRSGNIEGALHGYDLKQHMSYEFRDLYNNFPSDKMFIDFINDELNLMGHEVHALGAVAKMTSDTYDAGYEKGYQDGLNTNKFGFKVKVVNKDDLNEKTLSIIEDEMTYLGFYKDECDTVFARLKNSKGEEIMIFHHRLEII